MENRRSFRFDKAFPVTISSRMFGECHGIARHLSSVGMFLEIADPLPLGTPIRVHFTIPDSTGEIVARGEVKGHYYLNFSDDHGPRTLTGMGVRFVGFEDGTEEATEDFGMRACPTRILH